MKRVVAVIRCGILAYGSGRNWDQLVFYDNTIEFSCRGRKLEENLSRCHFARQELSEDIANISTNCGQYPRGFSKIKCIFVFCEDMSVHRDGEIYDALRICDFVVSHGFF
jgi:hypothetical protein